MNQFGGTWTEAKMEIVVSYAQAYLIIMNKQNWVKTIYFDGFAGSGLINSREAGEFIKGTALRILDIVEPRPFNMYYFVELKEKYRDLLDTRIQSGYRGRNAFAVNADCNEKLCKLAGFLQEHNNYRALAFIDPYGMSVNWQSIEALKGLGVDLWILVPTGLGVNRLLENHGRIPDPWMQKLEKFLGIGKDEILAHFYRQQEDLFGNEINEKSGYAVHKVGELYRKRLNEVFNFVSDSFIMRNSTNSIMYHFMMATNNAAALKIANDVIKPKYKS